MKKVIYAALIVITLCTLALYIKAFDFKFSLSSLGFSLWGLSPWLLVTFLVSITSNERTLIATCVLSSVLAVGGLWAIVDVMFIHIDAQGGLVLLFLPFWQLMILALSSIPILMYRNPNNAKQG